MKKAIDHFSIFLLIFSLAIVLPSYKDNKSKGQHAIKFPYKEAGLTEEQAVAHLLNRFSFGPLPGQVAEVQKMGLENWFLQQLDAKQPNEELDELLTQYPLMSLSTQELAKKCVDGGQVLKMAIEDTIISKEDVAKGKDDIRKLYRDDLAAYMKEKGLVPRQEMVRQLICQKIIRSLKSQNQLQEVLTNFWFNHFNVSLTKNESARFIPTYERDVIRPNVLGHFEDLLLATAKSPAMLTYLDNSKSMVAKTNTTAQQQMADQRTLQMLEQAESNADDPQKAAMIEKVKAAKKEQGINENYAREIMELHTMGVDGGYTQSDVTQAARVLTGWTVYPMEGYGGDAGRKLLSRFSKEQLAQRGFVEDGVFLFNANKHDKGTKTVLGTSFAAGGGYEEGEKLIHMLATHSSTASFISRKLAIHFVNDNPPKSLVDKMAKTFTETGGDIRQVLITMATSPEFWSKEAVREKTKSPLQLAISSLRSLDADVKAPFAVYTWVAKMGENLYYYQAPTGFPDRGQYWINTGSLLYRMNFGLALATQRIPGVSFDLAALNHNKEPESPEAALATYGHLLMPGRDLSETINRLQPMLNDPELVKKINAAITKTASPPTPVPDELTANPPSNEMMMSETGNEKPLKEKPGKKTAVKGDTDISKMMQSAGNNGLLANVVGILFGSPEFQRR
jgi:uncharacterized protein (DUF1800 family)